MLHILAALRFAAEGLALKDLSEDLTKMRCSRVREVKTLEAEIPSGSASMLFQHALRVETVQVIKLPLHRITEDLISLRHPLETFLGVAITRIDVRMIPPSQFPKGSLDLVDGSRSADLEDSVKFVSTGHVEGSAL